MKSAYAPVTPLRCRHFDFSRLSGLSDGKKRKVILEALIKIANNRGNRIFTNEELTGHIRAMGVEGDARDLIEKLNASGHILKCADGKWRLYGS